MFEEYVIDSNGVRVDPNHKFDPVEFDKKNYL